MPIIIDLSSNNGHPIDYAQAAASGVIAAIVKATDGTSYVNPYYTADSTGFEAVGVPVIAYHFAEFGDAIAEAAHFVSVAGSRARVLDSETNADVEWQNEFLAALNLPGNEEMDYGSASTLPRSGIRSLLWPASYGRNYGFGDAWQFTDAQVVPGIPGLVDASLWIGSPADFDSLFDIDPPTPPAPPEVSQMPGLSEAVVIPNGQEHRSSVFLGALGHYWRNSDGTYGVQNVAQIADPTGADGVHDLVWDADQVPSVQILSGQIVIGAVTTAGEPFVFRQTIGTAGWGVEKIT